MSVTAVSVPKPNAAGLRRTIGREAEKEWSDPPQESFAANTAALHGRAAAPAAGSSVKETKESAATQPTASAPEEVIREVGIKVDRCNVKRSRCNARHATQPTQHAANTGALHTGSIERTAVAVPTAAVLVCAAHGLGPRDAARSKWGTPCAKALRRHRHRLLSHATAGARARGRNAVGARADARIAARRQGKELRLYVPMGPRRPRWQARARAQNPSQSDPVKAVGPTRGRCCVASAALLRGCCGFAACSALSFPRPSQCGCRQQWTLYGVRKSL